ncbi:hypothetical protein JCM8208_002235 [Rhodotorula glutinis]
MAPQKKTAVVNAIQHVASLHKELAKAHKQATVAVLEYAAELEESGADKNALATFPSLFPELAEAPLTKKRGRKSVGAEDGDEVDGKKRRSTKEKKVKDPNAPKRPASAYLEYQNSCRESFRQQYPDDTYAEVLKKIGQSWQNLSDAEKAPWQAMTAGKTAVYLEAKSEYEKTDPNNASPEEQEAVAIATEPKAKRPRKSEATADIAVDATPKEKKAKSAKKAASPPKAATPPASSSSEESSEEDDESSSEEEATPPPKKVISSKKDKAAKASKK